MTGAGGRAAAAATVTPSGLELTLLPAAVVSLAVKAYAPADKFAVVKLQAPVPLAVVVPSGLAPPSETVTVAPFGAVPVRVTESLELTALAVITGAAGAVLAGSLTTCVPSAFDSALVPPGVVSVA
jgi:hypothetical protein